MGSSGKASCLKDTPTLQEQVPKDLPGVLYDADDQCKLWVGTKYYPHSVSSKVTGSSQRRSTLIEEC